jgi:gliding motility-associated lipoprotein GldH
MKYIYIFSIFLLSSLFSGCDSSRIYDTHVDLKNGFWNEKDSLIFDFEIKEKEANELYNIYYNVRYANTYPFHNLYVHYYLSDSTGKNIANELQQMNLFTPTTGEPIGKGLGDLYDAKILAITKYKFPSKGKFSMKVKQYMRQNQLPGINSFGISIEKMANEVD